MVTLLIGRDKHNLQFLEKNFMKNVFLIFCKFVLTDSASMADKTSTVQSCKKVDFLIVSWK